MASGKKDYFRHSFHAHNDIKFCNASKEDIFHYWVILELCGQQCHEGYPEKFKFHTRNLCLALRLKKEKIISRLESLEGLFLISSLTVADNQVELVVPNFRKFIGSYSEKEALIKGKERKEKEILETTISLPTGEDKNPSLTHELELIWNNNCGNLSKIKGLSKKRLSLCKNRWKENSTQDYWTTVVKEISQSLFCLGKNDRGWKANFDWFLRPDTHLKVLEGNYRGKGDQLNESLEILKKNKEENKNGPANQYLRKNKSSEVAKKESLLEL